MKYKSISLPINSSIKDALQKMDESFGRLLIVLNENGEYRSLISIGDLQRHLIKFQDFKAPISEALRDQVTVAYTSNTKDEVKNLMIKYRAEFMPILNGDNQLIDVVYWDDILSKQDKVIQNKLELPIVVMAGGKGTRLRPITHIIPKPLIPVGEKPIIEIIVDKFVDAGCTDFYFSVGYKANMLKAYFDDLANKKYDITYFSEKKPMGTAGSLSLIKDKIQTSFIVSNCDIIIEEDFSEIYKYHRDNGNELTAVAFIKEMEIPYGTFEVEKNGILKSLIEKPAFTFFVNAGLYILEPHLLDEIPEDEFFHITHLMENIMKRDGKIGVFPITEGSWTDIGQWKEYQKTLKRYGHEIEL